MIPIQKSKLTRRRACDSTDSTARRENEVRLFFLDWCEISKALLCTAHPPARVRQIFGFVKALGCVVSALPAKFRIQHPPIAACAKFSDGLFGFRCRSDTRIRRWRASTRLETDRCKTPVLSLLRRQEPSLVHYFSCRMARYSGMHKKSDATGRLG